MAGKIRIFPTSSRNIHPIFNQWARFGRRLFLAFFFAWVILIVSLSSLYLRRLLYPGCPPSAEHAAGYQSIRLITKDQITLRGWWKPPQNGAVILLLAGHGGSRDAMLPEADILSQAGYGVLTLETRACIGKMATLGNREMIELQAMLEFAQNQPHVDWIGVLGFSAGGVTAIRGAAEMRAIQAVIAEGNYRDLAYEIRNSNPPVLSVEWQIHQMVSIEYWLLTGTRPARVSPIQSLPFISPRPVLLIHGEKEAEITRAQEQFSAAGSPKELWIVPGAGHGNYRTTAGDLYAARIIQFFDQNR